MAHLINNIRLQNFLSFGPNGKTIRMENLNVLIGPNGSGKSNFIEALEVLHATAGGLSELIRQGGAPADWIWRGRNPGRHTSLAEAQIEAVLRENQPTPEMLYRLAFTESGGRLEITDEALEDWIRTGPTKEDVRFYYRFQAGRPVIRVTQHSEDDATHRTVIERFLKRENVDPRESALVQLRDPELYPELTTTAKRFAAIRIFREWSFGRTAGLRMAQPANLPTDTLLPNLVNLGLILNDMEHRSARWNRLLQLMGKFLPRFQRLSTKVAAGAVQIFFHEDGLSTPVPATRLSDGSLRFLSLLAILLDADQSPLVCVEEPELGMHPDAMAILGQLMIEASEMTQLVVTTHSEALVSALSDEAKSVMVCNCGPDGTEFDRLEPDKLKSWLKDYTLGDIWRSGKLGGNLW